ncbi:MULTISPECIES: 4-(cytidine 5'-diphospho)-2-C-methyl-D-erythritol kinase [Clostridium]|uniref:4-(cytidine 5'-diphospho)-2-C-methyl-D-erythritol kinase n=1 Tax=Clostridium TaxID=1485 RepID=UPI0008249605|nr:MULTISPECIES: 4-(cytidine 5'-diphospho)-2-C-methyl-D-erythritol kinase [Clostridium]PJI09122.1 4-(cytidine 5'-diphospho)-2-C-methyl-D-erythritol kinase [Clostridium sp. CT7]
MEIKAYAKINISLDVVGKREDGYHLLKMIMQSIDLYDVIDIKAVDKGIRIASDSKKIPNDSRNIAYRAAKLFLDTYKIKSGVSIHIKKNIPVAAGLAGGSTDGAAVLKLLRKLFKPELTDNELINLGVKIGADIPFCIVGGTALCEGIGEKITVLKKLGNKILVLVKPEFGVSTKEVYMKYDGCKNVKHPDSTALIRAVNDGNFNFVVNNMVNVLENVTSSEYEDINKIKCKAMEYKALGSMMSGSGPTVFSFFKDNTLAQEYFNEMKKKYKQVFIVRTV